MSDLLYSEVGDPSARRGKLIENGLMIAEQLKEHLRSNGEAGLEYVNEVNALLLTLRKAVEIDRELRA